MDENSDSDKEELDSAQDQEKILCLHCRRTETNGIRCLGMCVADNEY